MGFEAFLFFIFFFQIINFLILSFPLLDAVCDDTCKEVILDPVNELLVCTISGHCFDQLVSTEIEPDFVSKFISLA